MFTRMRQNKLIYACAATLLLTGPASADSTDIRVLVVPKHEAKLASQLNERVLKLPIKEGERFKKGQLLVQFDCAVRKAELAQQHAELRGAKATLASNQKLRELGSGTQLELENAKSKVEQHQAQVERSKALVRQCRITAPFSGRVNETLVNPYEYVRSGEPLLDILNDNTLYLEMFVPSHWLKQLQKQQTITVHIAETGQRYDAKISSIGARVDPVSRSVAIRAEFLEQHAELLAGMSGNAQFSLPDTQQE